MRKSLALATLGAVVALVPAVFCQTPSDQQATPDAQAEPQVRVIAPDDQPSKEQMARLFDAMHLRQQMANMTKTLPAMMQQQVSQQIKANQRLCLTGTPMENHLGELWSLFHLLLPGFLGDQKSFQSIYRRPIEKDGDQARRR